MPRAKKKQTGLVDTWGRRNRKLADRVCPQCGRTYRPLCKSSKYCSRECMWSNNGGQNKKAESWWLNNRGYIEGRIWLPDGTQIRMKQHRFVMEGLLGRPLDQNEDVHHIDGNKTNNKPENLELIKHGEHSRRNNKSRIYKKGYKVKLSESERRARSLRAIALGLSRMGSAAISKAQPAPSGKE